MRSFPFVAVLLISMSAPAGAADLISPAPVTEADVYAACASDNALARIQRIFAHAEETLWHRGFVIDSIDNPRPSGHPYAEPGLVRRDYCMADTLMSNGAAYPVFYVIEHQLGFVGIGSEVDHCILGLDPWRVHDGGCRTVR